MDNQLMVSDSVAGDSLSDFIDSKVVCDDVVRLGPYDDLNEDLARPR